MTIRLRRFDARRDFEGISAFLTRLYRPGNSDGNWFQAIWEYAYTHPSFDETAVDRIGVWEAGGGIVAVAAYETRPGEAFFNTSASYGHLKAEMLEYAERNLAGRDSEGRGYLEAYIADFDLDFQRLAAGRGYRKHSGSDRPMSMFAIPAPFPPVVVPEGFRLSTLAEDNDLEKVNRVLYRGFDHPGEPPPSGVAGRAKMQSGPHYRRDLTVVVVAPEGHFVSYCGMWYDERGRFAYVEPVATDPDFRRRGLGRAAVLEGIRRCAQLGATVAYVGADLPFYLSFGFRRLFTVSCWLRSLE